MKKNILLFIVTILFLPIQIVASNKPAIVVSSAPLKHVVHMLTGESFAVASIALAGGCAHHHHARPSDRNLVRSAKLVIYISDEFENFLPKLADKTTQSIYKIDAIENIDFTYQNNQNWHFWLDLDKTEQVILALNQYLQAEFPEHKNTLEQNTQTALAELKELKQLKQEAFAEAANLVNLSGDALPFFASSYENFIHHPLVKHPSLRYTKKLEQIISGKNQCYILDFEQELNLVKKYNLQYTQLPVDNWNNFSNYQQAYRSLIKLISECGE